MKKKRQVSNSSLLFEELEPRLLLSADGLAVITESSVVTTQELVLGNNESNTLLVQNYTEQSSVVVQAKHQNSELVIIDSRAPNFQQLHNDIIHAQQQGRNIQVVILDAHRDGIEQISEALTTYDSLDAVHIVSHGESGKLQLGATQLDKQALKHRSDEIKQWQKAFVDDGDLLLYGCNLAGTTDGQSLVNELAKQTQTDVAASDDLTGNSILGGDWDLEYQTGEIESKIAFSQEVQTHWQGILEANTPVEATDQLTIVEEKQQQETNQQSSTEEQAAQAALIKKQQADNAEQEKQQIIQAEEQRNELVFIDKSVTDYQQFVDDLKNNSDSNVNFEIIIIEDDSNGVQQISDYLSNYNDVDAVHIFSHGKDGGVKLGDTWLQSENLSQYSNSINGWRDSLDIDADILIYGCNLAASNNGEQFIDQLSSLSGADVAASDDLTGATILGGDWQLEYQRGEIETSVALTATAQSTYESVLATFIVSNTNATGAGSLHQAILDANANVGVTDTISFNIGGGGAQTILVDAAGLPGITDSIILDATTQPGYSGTPLITLDGSATPASSGINGITLRTNDSTVKGFIVINFADEGIEIDGSTGFGDNNIVQNNWVGVDKNGTVASNAEHGVMISVDATGNLIGGTGIDEGNVIANTQSGFAGIVIRENSNNNVVEGNMVGVLADGVTLAGNDGHGILIEKSSDGNTIGGTVTGAGNVIAGNTLDGIHIDGTTDATYTTVSTATAIQGNWIGTTGTGSIGAGNGNTGIFVEGADTIIGGTGTNDGNVITSNGNEGINLTGSGATGTLIQGNIIGLDPDGVSGSGNSDVGIALLSGSDNTTIGGVTAAARNIISNNFEGIEISSNNNTVQGNYIGTDITGALDRGNHSSEGVQVKNVSSGNLIGGTAGGSGNIIAYSGSDGVQIAASAGGGNAILGNSIFANTGMALDLNMNGIQANDSPDVDGFQNFPIISSATTNGVNTITIGGTFNSTASTTFRIEFFSNSVDDGNGEGETYLGFVNVTTDGSGNATFSTTISATVASGSYISATATNLTTNDTSEFAQNVIATVSFIAPINSVPAAQTTNEDTPLVFNTANSNLVSIDDADAGSNPVEVTLSVTNGVLTLSGLTGLTFSTGDGAADASMTFTGTLTDINNALDGLSYTPDGNYNGADTLTLSTLDSELTSITIDANLLGYYSFDDTAALGNDDSPAGANDATINGATATVDGTRGDVLSFDGNDNIQINGLFGNPVDVTLAAWVDLTTVDTNSSQVISLGDSVILVVDRTEGGPTGVGGAYFDGVNWHELNTGTFIEGTGWHHIAYAFDDTNDTHTIYIDGVAINSAAVTDSISYTLGADTYIGTHATGATTYDFTGKIDDARIYDRFLTANEIATLANDVNLQDTDTIAITVDAVNDAPIATNDPGSYNTDILALSPDGYWRLGESAGSTVSDDGGVANSGTYNGVTLGQAGAIAGDSDTAVSFDGLDDYVVVPHDPSYLMDNGTVQLWFKTSDVNQRSDLFSKDALGNVDGGHLSIYLDGAGDIAVRLQSNSSSYITSSTLPLVNDQWHHVAFTFGDDGMQLYVDGQFQDSDAYTGGLGTTSGGTGNAEPIAIGASTQVSTGGASPLQDFFSGSIDEVALFGSALSSEQIQNLYVSALQNYTILEDTSLNVSAAEGVLINDSDPDGDPLTAALVSGPANAASFTLNVDGSFSYTPTANFSGIDTFTYMANDGSANSSVATVTITITGDNDAPVNTVPGTQAVLEDTQTTITGISVADPDAGASVMTTQLTVTNGVLDVTLSGVATISAGANSSSTLTISGNITDINATLTNLNYTGNLNVNGIAADTLSIVTNDLGNTGSGGAQSDIDNVQINITAVNDAPVARDDRIGLVFDGVDDYVRIGDYPGLNVSNNVTIEAWIKPTGLGTGSQIIINKEGEYEVGITADTGEIKWAFDNVDPDWSWHNTGYFAQAGEWTHIAVTYNNGVVNTYADGVVIDTYNGSGAIADAYPTMNDLTVGGRENAVTQRFDGQIDEVRIWNTTRSQLEIQNNMSDLLTGGEAGLIGNWRFDEGSGTTVADQSMLGHHGTLADGVTAGEMPSWQGYVVSEDSTLNVSALNGVLPNDYDLDGDALTAVIVSGPTNAAAFTLNPDGSFSYTPNTNFNGIDSFTYMANDGSDDSNVATVTIRVDPVNDAPIAVDDTTALDGVEDSTSGILTATLLANDSDLDGDAINITAIDGTALIGGVQSIAVTNGTVNIDAADNITFTAAADYNGPVSFSYTISDGSLTDIATASGTITPVNDTPTIESAIPDQVLVEDFASYTIDLNAAFDDIETADNALLYSVSGNTNINVSITSGIATITPTANWNGSEALTFSATDTGGLSASQVVNFTVNSVNDAPTVANAIADVTVAEDAAPTVIDLSTVFADVDIGTNADSLSYSAVSSDGTLVIASVSGSTLTLTYAANQNGTATVTVTATDTNGPLAVADPFTVTVNPVNDAPTVANAIADVTVAEDAAPTVIDLSTVFADVDIATNADSLSYSAVSSDGTLVTASVSGTTLTLTYAANQNGTATVTVTATDSNGPLAVADPFTVTVNPVNDAPTVANAIADVTVAEDAAATVIDLSSVFVDVDIATNADSLSYSAVSSDGTLVTASVSGSTLTLTYAAGQSGTATVTVTATDSDGPLAVADLFTVTVTPVNDTPTIESTIPDQVLAEDFASYTIDLNAAFDDIETADNALVYSVTGNTNINVSITSGIATITPTANWNGSEALTFSATDTGGLSASQVVNFTVNPVNDTPTIESTIPDQVLAEDFASYTIDLNAAFDDIETADNALLYSVSGNTNINVSIASGIATITPTANWNGSETLTFSATDTGGLSASQVVNFTVNPVNDAPTVANAIADVTVAEDAAPTVIDLSTVFADVDIATNADSLSYSAVSSDGTLVTASVSGTTLTLTYAANQNGTATVTVTATDSNGPLAVADPFTVTVTPVNDTPTNESTIPDQVLVEDFASYTIDLNAAFDDIETADNALVYSVTGNTNINVSITSGIATITPTANWNGSEALTFTVTDAGGLSASQVVNFTVNPVNDAPIALNDIPVALDEGATAIFDLAGNDTDVENALDLNSIVITGAPANGSLTVNGSGTVTYTHNGSETTSDSFSYTIADLSGTISNTATVNITINPINDLPDAQDDVQAVDEGGTVNIDLAANDTDVDSILDLSSITITGDPVNGILTVNANGTVDYTHDGSQTLADSFSYTIADISGAVSNIATVNISVNPVNNAPSSNGIADITVTEDSVASTINLNDAFDDVDNLDSELTYSIVGNTSIGLFTTAAINPITGELVLDYAVDMNGSSQISIRATDPLGGSVDTLFTVTVTPVNDTPVLAANTGMSASGTSGNVITNAELNVNDVDNPDTAIIYTVTTLPTSGVLMLDGVPLTINSSFTEDDVANNRLSYQADATSTTDQFSFIVSDGDGGVILANTFEIVVQFALPSPEPEPETIVPDVPPVITGSPVEDDPESTINLTEVESEDIRDIDGLYVGGSFRTIPQPGLTLEPVQPVALDQPTQNVLGDAINTAEPGGIYDKDNLVTASTVADIQVKSIKALWVAIDDMRQQIDEDLTEDVTQVQVKLGAISGSGVALTAGIVAWVLRSGALMTSLISTIPLWKGYDPLPVLAYRDDDEEKDDLTEDKIPTSLEELKKIKELREKMKKYNQVDDLFGGSEIKG